MFSCVSFQYQQVIVQGMSIPNEQDGKNGMAAVEARREPRESQVVVDVREFRSQLPLLLHQQHALVVPVTLEVGDYVLSPDVCLERKAIPDLFQSLPSGRL